MTTNPALVPTPEHAAVPGERHSGHTYAPCQDGQLVYCTRCGGFEGSMTMDCIGHENELLLEMVYRDNWDFRSGQWVKPVQYVRTPGSSGKWVHVRGHMPTLVKG